MRYLIQILKHISVKKFEIKIEKEIETQIIHGTQIETWNSIYIDIFDIKLKKKTRVIVLQRYLGHKGVILKSGFYQWWRGGRWGVDEGDSRRWR